MFLCNCYFDGDFEIANDTNIDQNKTKNNS